MTSISAQLEDGDIVSLAKDCTCGLHHGPHWLHMDEVDRRLNAKLLANGQVRACALAEIERTAQLVRNMRRCKIVRIIRSGPTDG